MKEKSQSFKKIILIGNGKLSKSLQKYLINYQVEIFDKDNINLLNHAIGDLLIDCSLSDSFEILYSYIKSNLIPTIICSTNHSPKQLEMINELALYIPLFKEDNFSLGINLINKILKENNRLFNKYTPTLIDIHHEEKIDAPSGTSKKLIKQLKKDVKTYSIRVSKVIGEHNLRFFAEDEEITITHKITSRDVFAKGILLAIDFLKNKDNGFYTMEDIINEI